MKQKDHKEKKAHKEQVKRNDEMFYFHMAKEQPSEKVKERFRRPAYYQTAKQGKKKKES